MNEVHEHGLHQVLVMHDVHEYMQHHMYIVQTEVRDEHGHQQQQHE